MTLQNQAALFDRADCGAPSAVARARALRHIAGAERAASEHGVAPVALDHVMVAGGGPASAGLARALIDAGLRVTLVEDDAEDVRRVTESVERALADALERGEIGAACAAAHRAALVVTDDMAAGEAAGLAIDTASRSVEDATAALARLQAALPAGPVLATCGVAVGIDRIAAGLDDPARVLGLQVHGLAQGPRLVEIASAAASDRALAIGLAFARRLGAVPVRAARGGLGHRLTARFDAAADVLLIEGTNPWELDEAMEAFGFRTGPCAAQDIAGLDGAYAERRRTEAGRAPIRDRMVEEGRLGRKAGVGWYRYPGGGGKVVDPLIEDLIREEAHFAKVIRREFPEEELCIRMQLALISVAADMLAEGAATAADIDLVSVAALGFPRERGGLMWYAETLGAARVLDALEALAAEHPAIWGPGPAITQCARDGRRFAEIGG